MVDLDSFNRPDGEQLVDFTQSKHWNAVTYDGRGAAPANADSCSLTSSTFDHAGPGHRTEEVGHPQWRTCHDVLPLAFVEHCQFELRLASRDRSERGELEIDAGHLHTNIDDTGFGER